MKQIYNLLLTSCCLLLLSCSDPITIEDYSQKENPSTGFWEVHLSGDLSGAATIQLQSNGNIQNGIPIDFGIVKLNTYIKGQVKNNGTLKANFFNSFVNDTIRIISDGTFTGTFSDSIANGNYTLTVNDSFHYSGAWQSIKLE